MKCFNCIEWELRQLLFLMIPTLRSTSNDVLTYFCPTFMPVCI